MTERINSRLMGLIMTMHRARASALRIETYTSVNDLISSPRSKKQMMRVVRVLEKAVKMRRKIIKVETRVQCLTEEFAIADKFKAMATLHLAGRDVDAALAYIYEAGALGIISEHNAAAIRLQEAGGALAKHE